MKYFFIVIFLLLLFIFSSLCKRGYNELPHSEKVTNALLCKAAILLKKKYDIKPIGANIPNRETLVAINQIERGENLVKSKDVNDFFKKLGI